MNLSFLKKRRRIVLIFAGCALTVLFLIFLWPESEPSYKGKSLSQWLTIYGEQESSREEAAEAVRAIGTNSLPVLVKRLHYEPGRMHNLARSLVDKLPDAISESRAADYVLNRGYYHSDLAYSGFMILGQDASPAIPGLISMICDTNSQFSNLRALNALACIGPKALPAVSEALSDRKRKNRDLLLGFVDAMANSVNGPEPFAVLAHSVGDSDRNVAERAVTALGIAPLYPEITVSALAQALRSPNRRLRLEAANALANFGPEAHSAIPQLQEILKDADRQVRFAATNALNRIAPESQPKSGSEN